MKRIADRLPELTLALAVCVLFYRLLLGEVLFWGTPGLQFYPWRDLAFSELRHGRLPLWNPLVGNGAPLLANYQTAVFYPPNWPNLILPTAHLMGWLGMLHLMWAGLGMLAYLRRLGIDRFGQGMGGLAYALSGYLVSRFGFLSITAAAPWLPWLLWALDGLWGVERLALRRRVALLGAVAGMQLLAGHAQTTFYSLLLAGLYALWRSVQQRAPGRLLPALGGLALGVGLAAIQLLPTLELMLTSQRSAGVDEALALTYSYWPWRPLTWVAPNLFGSPAAGDYWGYGAYWEDATYVGLLSVLLAARAVIGWLRAPREDAPGRPLVPFFAAIIPPALLLALGKNTPVFVWLFRNVPTFNLFQAPARWMLLAVFAMAVLAGIGAHRWAATERGLFWTRLSIAGGVSALAAALLAQRQLGAIEPTFVSAMMRLGVSIIAVGALILLQPEPDLRLRRLWEGAALVLLAADLTTAGWGLNPTIDPAFYRARSPLAADLSADLESSRMFYLPQDEYAAKFSTFLNTKAFGPTAFEAWEPLRQSLLPNLGMLDGAPSANNFDPLRVGPHDALTESLRDAPLDDALPRLQAMNVGVLLTTGPRPGDLPLVARAGPVAAYRLPNPMPRAYVVAQAWHAEDVDEALSAMTRADFDPARVAVLEDPTGPPPHAETPGAGRANPTQRSGTARLATTTNQWQEPLPLFEIPPGTARGMPGWIALTPSTQSHLFWHRGAAGCALSATSPHTPEPARVSAFAAMMEVGELSHVPGPSILTVVGAKHTSPLPQTCGVEGTDVPVRFAITPGIDTPGTATILHQDSTAITISVQSRTPGWLVLTDTWYPGWRATVSGEPAPILRANGAFRAVAVPQGQHTVRFTYRPRMLIRGAAVSGLAGAAALALVTRRKRHE